jgi:uncharacterized peroxidase-related enzyme
LLGTPELARALARDYRTADLDDADRTMLSYAVKLTRAPCSIESGDADALRRVGFDDTAILDICQVVSYYNYVNRLADGLGVELEPSWKDEELTITRAELDELLRRKHRGRGEPR